jgi:hypothetical protein
MARNSDSLAAAVASKTYTSFGSDIDLKAATLATSGLVTNAACRRIRINAAGSGALSLQYADGSTDTITGLQQGDQLDVQATAILASGTSVASVTVFW